MTLPTISHTDHGKNESMSNREPAGTWARVRRAAAELTPDAIEQIAQRVAALLREHRDQAGARPVSAGLLDASQLARHLGVTRTWVYEHANQLGAIRLGAGSKARLRFDLDTATAAIDRRRVDRQNSRGAPAAPRASRHRPRRAPASTTPLVPISPPRSRGILSRLVRGQRRGDR
jgi:hypothetical protein